MADFMRIDEEIRKELGEGEEELWRDQPDPKKMFVPIDIYYIPASLLAAVLFYYVFRFMLGDDMFSIRLILTIPIAVLALFNVFGRFIYKYYRKKRTIYLITDKRAVEIFLGLRRKVKSLDYSQIKELRSKINKTGDGNIMFEKFNFFKHMGLNTGNDFFMQRGDEFPRFFDLKDVQKPLGIIRKRLDELNGEKA